MGSQREGVLDMEWEDKAWGICSHIFASDRCGISFLKVEKGGFSSRHLHRERENMFAVISGKIEVCEYYRDFVIKLTTMASGDVHSVPVEIIHKFSVLESGEVVEIYRPGVPGGKVHIDDIVRFDIGGMEE